MANRFCRLELQSTGVDYPLKRVSAHNRNPRSLGTVVIPHARDGRLPRGYERLATGRSGIPFRSGQKRMRFQPPCQG